MPWRARQKLTPPQAQIGGIALGLAISGAVFINKATAGLTAVLPDLPTTDIQLALAGTSNKFLVSLSEEVRAKCTDAIVEGLRNVFIPAYVGAAIALVLSVCFTVSVNPVALQEG